MKQQKQTIGNEDHHKRNEDRKWRKSLEKNEKQKKIEMKKIIRAMNTKAKRNRKWRKSSEKREKQKRKQ